NPSSPEAALALLDFYNQYGALLDASNFDFSIQMMKKGLLGDVLLMQPLFAGGRIVNGNKLAKLGVTSANYQYQMAEKEVMLTIETYYWNIISLQEKLKMLQQSENLLDTIYYQVEGAIQNDLALQNDKMKVKLKRDELRLNRKKLENGMNISKQLLCQFIGIDNHEDIILLDTLNTNEITLQNMSIAPDVTSLPEYKLLDLNVQAKKYQQKMTLGESMPQIAVGAAYLYYNLNESHNNNMALVASLSIPISDWWKTSHNYKKQKIDLEVAEKTRQDVAQKLDLQTQQFINEITEAYEEMHYWEKAIVESTENYRIVNNYYLCSMNTISDLLEAQTTLQSTKNQYIESCINYKIKSLKYLQLFSN
ncbi:MAG: TolC family protein, partial [Bacteroidales bacterium]|nr:TolC family protein [Bacteroidales bacterium]